MLFYTLLLPFQPIGIPDNFYSFGKIYQGISLVYTKFMSFHIG